MSSPDYIQTDLAKFNVGNYNAGPKWKVAVWYILNSLILDSFFPWPYSFKVALLRGFGAKIGTGLIIKPNIRIKNPWKLVIGNNCWIGESVWIDNLVDVIIGNNVCLSQGALLLTGNHDYTSSDFAYRLQGITIEDGVWIGAQATVCPGVCCKTHSILTVKSVATKNLEAWTIYSGNPSKPIRNRKIIK
jgi:putative colanic acid biosynthesis acetyltransferase WcaF